MDAVWVWAASNHGRRELQYSIASVVKYVPEVTRCVVLSANDPGIPAATWINTPQKGGNTDEILHSAFSRNLNNLSDKWLWLCDDWYFLRRHSVQELSPTPAIGVLSGGRPTKLNAWQNRLWDSIFKARELDDCSINFCSHCPQVIDKTLYKQRLGERPEFYGQIDTWLYSHRGAKWQPADNLRAMWVKKPDSVASLEASTFDGGRGILAHNDGAICSHLWDFLNKHIGEV